IAGMLLRMFSGHHVPALQEEAQMLTGACAFALTSAILSAMLYMAVEPYVRRRMPELLIGWARLLEGRLTDPRVGRSIPVRALVGGVSAVLLHLSNALRNWVPIFGQTPVPPEMRMLEGAPVTLAVQIGRAPYGLLSALSIFFLLFLLRAALRRPTLALIVLMI